MKSFNKSLICFQIAAIFVSTVLAGSKASEKANPFHGTLQGPEIFEITFPQLVVNGEGSGNATHLGHYTASWHRQGSLIDGSQTASYQYVAANGDQLFIESVGQADFSLAPDIHVVESGTITGGTGRFAGATGMVTIERIVVATGPWTTITSDTIDGSIVLAKGK